MKGRTLIIAIVIASLFRHVLPFIDAYFLLFLFVILRNPEDMEETLKYFLIGTFFASLLSGVAIGLLPLVTTAVFLLLNLFQLYKSPKGLPTVALWLLAYAVISGVENGLFAYFSTGIFFISNITLQTILVTIIVSVILREFAVLQKKI